MFYWVLNTHLIYLLYMLPREKIKLKLFYLFLCKLWIFNACLFLKRTSSTPSRMKFYILPFNIPNSFEFDVIIRDSHHRCSINKCNIHRKILPWSLYLLKLQASRPATVLKKTPTQVFCIARFLRTPTLKNICERLSLCYSRIQHINLMLFLWLWIWFYKFTYV